MSLQGSAKGVIECWQTSAVKLPVKQKDNKINITVRFEVIISAAATYMTIYCISKKGK